MVAARGEESKEEFDKDWIFPSFGRVWHHIKVLRQLAGAGKESTEKPDSSGTTLQLLQLENFSTTKKRVGTYQSGKLSLVLFLLSSWFLSVNCLKSIKRNVERFSSTFLATWTPGQKLSDKWMADGSQGHSVVLGFLHYMCLVSFFLGCICVNKLVLFFFNAENLITPKYILHI